MASTRTTVAVLLLGAGLAAAVDESAVGREQAVDPVRSLSGTARTTPL